jgi:hypothetical protein
MHSSGAEGGRRVIELIFCLGVAAVYIAAGIMVAIARDAIWDDDLTVGMVVTFWPLALVIITAIRLGTRIIELFRRDGK